MNKELKVQKLIILIIIIILLVLILMGLFPIGIENLIEKGLIGHSL